MAAAIAAITLGIGFNLKFKDFYRVIIKPKAALTGLFGQIILLPLLAVGVIIFWPIDNIYKVGFILIASCPGGSTSNFVTYFLKGRVPLSVTMTAFNSFIILLTIPVYLQLAYQLFNGDAPAVSLSFSRTFKEILLTVILPVFVGIGLNELTSDKFSKSVSSYLRYIITAILLAMVAVVLFFDEDQQDMHLFQNLHLLIPLVIFNIVTIFTGYLIASIMKLNNEGRFTIAIEMGLQNSALALFIANKIVEDEDLALIGVLYASFSLFTTWGVAYLLKHYSPAARREKQQSSESQTSQQP